LDDLWDLAGFGGIVWDFGVLGAIGWVDSRFFYISENLEIFGYFLPEFARYLRKNIEARGD
jgi:hypothetical protein